MEIYVCWHMCWTDSNGRSIKTAHKFKFLAGHCITILRHRKPRFQNHIVGLTETTSRNENSFSLNFKAIFLHVCIDWRLLSGWCMSIIFHSARTFIKCAKKWLDIELIGTMRMISPKLEGVGLLPSCSVYLSRTVRNTRYTFSPTDLGYSTMHWSIQIDVNLYHDVMWCANTYAFCAPNMAEQCNLLHLFADKK